MLLTEMYRTAKSLEAIDNYSRAGFKSNRKDVRPAHEEEIVAYDDEQFWLSVLQRRLPWGSKVGLYRFTLSEWVPRVPGLFWTEEAGKIRDLAKSAKVYMSGQWKALEPRGKSQKVMGGIGTLRFPPDRDGYRLVSVSAGMNASAGIPALISPDVWEFCKLAEGKLLDNVTTWKWQSMSGGWSERFAATREIPNGYLVLENPDEVRKSRSNEILPTSFHPFSVMEYTSGNSLLYDFVFATADTGEPKHRRYIERFFEQYKRDNNRYGRYLLAADVADPMWDADCQSPESLTRAEPGARSKLEILQARVNEETFSGKSLDTIAELLGARYQKVDLTRLSEQILIPSSTWDSSGSVSDAVSSLLATCRRREQVGDLIDAVVADYPESFV